MITLKQAGDYSTYNIDFKFILKETENYILAPMIFPLENHVRDYPTWYGVIPDGGTFLFWS